MQDKRDYMELAETRSAPSRERQRFNTENLKQASVKATALVHSTEWDTYLSHIQGFLNRLIEMDKIAVAKLKSSSLVKYEDMMECKMFIRETEAIIGCLEQIMQLPYAIIHDRSLLGDITSKIPIPKLPEKFLKTLV
jgi:hypothetical protein